MTRPWSVIVRARTRAHEALLAEAFAAIEESHGSVDRYLEEALGVDSQLRSRIEARILG